MNSLLMKRPRGWDHFFPLGAESSISMFLQLMGCEKYDVVEEENALVRKVKPALLAAVLFRHNIDKTRGDGRKAGMAMECLDSLLHIRDMAAGALVYSIPT